MARKRKVVDDKPAHAGSTPSKRDATSPTAKKRKIDWSTVDDFPGFKVTAVNVRAQKKSIKATTTKQKDSRNGGSYHYPGHDAPLDADVVQPNPFPVPGLSELHVKISPALYWESTNRYRKFTINGEEFQVGHMVFVRKSDEDMAQEGPDAIPHWLAKVLEVRAGDASHVYLRVFWAYRPEDLPGGRRPYHGGSELIVSNHMDIIEAVTVDAIADMVYWDDDPESMALTADQLFFRQSYDFTKKTHQLSKLNTYCIDKQPSNPDEPLVQCPHCSEWLHAGCLEKRALQDVSAKQVATPPKPKKRGRPSKGEAAPTFEAKIKGGASKTRLTVMEKQDGKIKRKWDVDIPCLMCGEIIEKASDVASEKPTSSTPASRIGDDALVVDIITPTKASGVSRTPIQDGEEDSVIGDADDDEDVEIKPAPTSDTESKVPRKRGRPLGSTNKKRKRASYGLTKRKSTLPSTKSLKTESGKEGPPLDTVQDMAVSAMVTTTATTALGSTEDVAATTVVDPAEDAPVTTKPEPTGDVPKTATHKTPAPAPISESVFQSGVRSVKRLL